MLGWATWRKIWTHESELRVLLRQNRSLNLTRPIHLYKLLRQNKNWNVHLPNTSGTTSPQNSREAIQVPLQRYDRCELVWTVIITAILSNILCSSLSFSLGCNTKVQTLYKWTPKVRAWSKCRIRVWIRQQSEWWWPGLKDFDQVIKLPIMFTVKTMESRSWAFLSLPNPSPQSLPVCLGNEQTRTTLFKHLDWIPHKEPNF